MTDYETPTAMMLTEREWQDLRTLATHAMLCCHGPCCDHQGTDEAQRIRLLAGKIIQATN